MTVLSSFKWAASVRRPRFPILLLLGVLLAASGCGRKSASPQSPLPTAQAPAAMQQAFATANAALAEQARAVAAAAQAKDPRAVRALLDLAARPELTADQRAAVNGCLQGLLQEAGQQAAQGSAAAETVLRTYRGSK